jgi:hypothetical protein
MSVKKSSTIGTKELQFGMCLECAFCRNVHTTGVSLFICEYNV